MMKTFLIILVLGIVRLGASSSTTNHIIQKRGIPHHTPYGTAEAGAAAIQQINDNERVAEYSASSAVGSAVGRDYSNRLATTAQFVAQFTVPVTKEQAGRLFDTVRNHQKASDISSALASNSYAIRRAADNAAQSNYGQAYQAEQLGHHRGGGGGYGHNGGGSGRRNSYY